MTSGSDQCQNIMIILDSHPDRWKASLRNLLFHHQVFLFACSPPSISSRFLIRLPHKMSMLFQGLFVNLLCFIIVSFYSICPVSHILNFHPFLRYFLPEVAGEVLVYHLTLIRLRWFLDIYIIWRDIEFDLLRLDNLVRLSFCDDLLSCFYLIDHTKGLLGWNRRISAGRWHAFSQPLHIGREVVANFIITAFLAEVLLGVHTRHIHVPILFLHGCVGWFGLSVSVPRTFLSLNLTLNSGTPR